MDTSRGLATSAPSMDDIHLSISFCLKRSMSGIASLVTRSGALIQNDSYSLFRVKTNNNRENRNLVTMKQYFISLKMLYCNKKLRYQWRNSMKFTSCIQMIQGTAISLNCDLKKHFLKKLCSSSQTTGVPTCDCQWFHWRSIDYNNPSTNLH